MAERDAIDAILDAIDADVPVQRPLAKSHGVDEGQVIKLTEWTRADRIKRQIIEVVEACETPGEVDDYIREETLMLDALYLFDQAMWADVDDAAKDQKIYTGGSSGPDPPPVMGTFETAPTRMVKTKNK